MLLELSVESGERSLDARRVVANEALSALFRVSVWARSPNPSLDLSSLVGRAATVTVQSPVVDALAPRRSWSGLCSVVEQVSVEPTGLSMYRLELVPTLWRATQRSGIRIFQHLSIPDLVAKLLTEWQITPAWEIDRGRYPKLEFKVQYGETDFSFICRLLEEAGITFLFEEREGESTLVLTDAPHTRTRRLTPLPYFQNASRSGKTEHVQELTLGKDLRSDSLVLFDYDFRRARALRAEALQVVDHDSAEQARYQPGAFLAELGAAGNTPAADDKGIARYDDGYGRGRASRLLAGVRHGHAAITMTTNAIDLRAGNIFAVARHAHADVEGKEWLSTDYALEASVEEEDFRLSVRALPAEVPYLPATVTKKPSIHGVQSAVVVGRTGGEYAEEIHVDEFGRVRVQFPWDREAEANDGASCWVRVNQGWAGRGYGMIQLPRVGQEVLITFLGGDPDQPLVTGRLFDSLNPVPYKLPENKTVSAYRSNSSPQEARGFNEIRVEDKKGKELLFFTAEKDQRVLVKHDETHTVLQDRSKGIGHHETDTTGVNRTEVTGMNRSELVAQRRMTHVVRNRSKRVAQNKGVRNEGNRRALTHKTDDRVVRGDKREWVQREVHVHVRGDLREAVDDKRSLIVDEEVHMKVGGSFAEASGRKSSYHADENLVGEAGGSVAVRGAGGFLAINGAGVVIQGTLVRINAGGSAGTSQQARPTMPLVARELLQPEMPESDIDGGLAEKWGDYDRTFAAIAALRGLDPNALGSAQGLFNLGGRLIQQNGSLFNIASLDKLGRSNLNRMIGGLAPLGSNGLPVRLVQAALGSGGQWQEAAGAVAKDLAGLLPISPKVVSGATAVATGGAWQPSYWRARAESFVRGGAGT